MRLKITNVKKKKFNYVKYHKIHCFFVDQQMDFH